MLFWPQKCSVISPFKLDVPALRMTSLHANPCFTSFCVIRRYFQEGARIWFISQFLNLNLLFFKNLDSGYWVRHWHPGPGRTNDKEGLLSPQSCQVEASQLLGTPFSSLPWVAHSSSSLKAWPQLSRIWDPRTLRVFFHQHPFSQVRAFSSTACSWR
jgi:hypothetical protein